jgi:hypothetical protein
MAYTYAYTGVGTPSTVLRSDGTEFPQDPALALYQEWQAWIGGGGTTTPAAAVSLDDMKDRGFRVLNSMAADARRALTQAGIAEDLGNALRFKEAQDYEVDGSPDPADYPMLAAEIPGNGADVDAVHDAVLAELATLKTGLAAIEVIRRDAYADIDAATTEGEITAILAAVDFTP